MLKTNLTFSLIFSLFFPLLSVKLVAGDKDIKDDQDTKEFKFKDKTFSYYLATKLNKKSDNHPNPSIFDVTFVDGVPFVNGDDGKLIELWPLITEGANWKFVLVVVEGKLVLRAANKRTYKSNHEKKSLHHPTLAGMKDEVFLPILTGGTIKPGDEGEFLINVDTGNYQLDKDILTPIEYHKHLLLLKLFFESKLLKLEAVLEEGADDLILKLNLL